MSRFVHCWPCLFVLMLATCSSSSPSGIAVLGLLGGTVRSADGVVELRVPAGALIEPVEVRVERLDDPALGLDGGFAYVLRPLGLVLEAPATLSLDPASAVAGSRLATNASLIGVQGPAGDPVPLATRQVDGRLEVEVAHFTRFGLTTATPVTDEDDALARFRDHFLPSLGAIEQFTTSTGFRRYENQIAAFGSYAVDAGDVIEPSAGTITVTAPDDSRTTIDVQATPGLQPGAPGWFFFVDLEAGAAYGHATLFVLLDQATGIFTVQLHQWNPVLNDVDLVPSFEAKAVSDKLLFPAAPQGRVAGTAPVPAARDSSGVAGSGMGKRVALLFTTTDEVNFTKSVEVMKGRLETELGFDPTNITDKRVFDSAELLAELDALRMRQAEECDCEPFKEVFVYLISHGDEGAFVFRGEGGVKLTDDNGDPAVTMDYDSLLLGLQKICTEELNVVIESCHAGALIDRLKQVKRLIDSRNPPAAILPLLCFKGTIVTSADAKQKARANSNFFGDVAEFVSGTTNPFLYTDTLSQNFMRDPDGTTDLFSSANAVPLGGFVNQIRSQNPQFDSFDPQVERSPGLPPLECECECELPEEEPIATFDTLLVEDDHTVGVTPCPQLIGRIRVTNARAETISVEVTPGPHIGVAPQVTLIDPGETREFEIFFLCTTQSGFSSRVDFLLRDGDETQTVTATATVNFP